MFMLHRNKKRRWLFSACRPVPESGTSGAPNEIA
jgi:hypothetical protein